MMNFLKEVIIKFSQSKFAFNVVDARFFPIYNDCSSFDTHNEPNEKIFKKHENYHFWLNYLCFDIFLKDLSLALGQTNRIPLSMASWIPLIVISIFSSVGILQINEK